MDKLFDIKNYLNLTPCRAQLTHETYLWKKDIHNESDLVTVGVCVCAVQNGSQVSEDNINLLLIFNEQRHRHFLDGTLGKSVKPL